MRSAGAQAEVRIPRPVHEVSRSTGLGRPSASLTSFFGFGIPVTVRYGPCYHRSPHLTPILCILPYTPKEGLLSPSYGVGTSKSSIANGSAEKRNCLLFLKAKRR